MSVLSSRVTVLTFVAGATLLLAACGGGGAVAGGDHGDHAAQEAVVEPVDGAPQVTVTAVDIDFQPETLELRAGEPVNVTVINDGEALHDFTVEEAGLHVNVDPGQSVTTGLTIDDPGTYRAVCTVPGHEDAGMVVDLVVQ